MATYADTLETPKQESGILSRMFNALTPKFLKDYISEIKQELKAVDREREWHRQDIINNTALNIIQYSTPENYDRDIQKMLDINKDTNYFDFGKITLEDIKNHIDSLSENEKGAHKRPSPSVETATFEA